MTRCLECSQVLGRDEDHTPAFHLPPLLVRFEHFLATRGLQDFPLGPTDPTLPTRAGKVPAKPMASIKHRYTCVMTLVPALTEMGYLEKADEAGRWNSVAGKDPRDVSARQIQDHLLRRFPQDPCRRHTEACHRCCLPHHISMYNKTCEAFRKMAEWLHFEERLYDKPVWSKDKLAEVYGVSRPVRYKVAPPEMNDVDRTLDFRAWLADEAKGPPVRGPAKDSRDRRELYDRAIVMYREVKDAKEVSRCLRLPYGTVYYWVTGRGGRRPSNEAIRTQMPRAYARSLWFLQETGARYEEMAHAEFPLEGPFVRWNRPAGTLTIVGKGREGGKMRTATLTMEQNNRLGELVAWRAELGKLLRDWTGRDPAPTLFVTLAAARSKAGNRLAESAGPWNETMKSWARRYNAWCEAQGHADRVIDVKLVTSHKIGRAVSITKLAREGVPEKVLMQERGIEDHNTVERYIRLSMEDRRAILEAAGNRLLARRTNGNPEASAVGNGNGILLEELRAFRAELREKDKRIQELTDRLLAIAR